MIEIILTDDPDQEFRIVLELKSVTMRVRWHEAIGRWHMDIMIGSEVIMLSRPIVVGVDLIEDLDAGIGKIFAWPTLDGAEPGRHAFSERTVRLYQANDADLVAAGVEVF